MSIFSEAPGEKDLTNAIANHFDLTALLTLQFDTSRVVRLPSEKAVNGQQSLTLSISKSLGLMMDKWFEELCRKDHSRDHLRAQKIHSFFKACEKRPSLHLFRSADDPGDPLLMNVALNPSLAHSLDFFSPSVILN